MTDNLPIVRTRPKLDKDERIIDLLARLRADLGEDAFDVVDHWKPDLCAIGIAMPTDHSQLFYISTHGHGDDEFDYELEIAPQSPDDIFDVAGRGDADSYSTLLGIVREHLKLES